MGVGAVPELTLTARPQVLFPFSGTYKMTPRARTERRIVFFAPTRAAAFQNFLRVTNEESFGKGVPCFVDALTCEQAAREGVPFSV